ncbi:MAG: CoA-binding protein, partial [Rhodospirillales bacterium]
MSSIMEKFFNPGSVAVIGASGSTGKPGNVVLRNMLDNGYQGEIFLVNPRGGEIEGRPVARSIDDLPADIDQAVVTLPAGLVPETVRALGVKGITAVVLAASGFAEVDEMGEGLQADLAKAIRDSGVRVLGPNTTGHISVPANFTS